MAIRRFDHLIRRFKAGSVNTNCLLAPWSDFGLGFLGPHKSFGSCSSSDDPKLDDVLNMFNGMTQTRPLPSVCKFNQLVDTVTNMKHYPRSIQIFKQMCAIGVPVDERTANIVIKSYSGMNDTEQGFTVLGYCFKRGIVPDVSTYNTLLNGFITQHRTHDAEALFKKLINNNNKNQQLICEPNLGTYNAMIKGLSKIGNHFAAIGLLRLMYHVHKRSDYRNPNSDTYRTIYDTCNTVVDGLCDIRQNSIQQDS